MVKRVFVLFLAWCVLFQSTVAVAASAAPEEIQKEHIVLLPIRGQGLTENELSLYRDAVAEGLSTNYTVKYGEQVDKVIQDIFTEESKSGLECDESRCYRDIATMLNVKLIAKAAIIPRARDYQVSMVIYNVYENKSVMTKVDVCKKCEPDQLVKKLVVLASAGTGTAAAPGAASAEGGQKEEGGVRWYWWLLGVVVAGGVAAAAGGSKGGGDGGTPTTTPTTNPSPNPGSLNTSW